MNSLRFPAWAVLTIIALCIGGCAAPGAVERFGQDPARRTAHVALTDGALDGVATAGGKAWLGVRYAKPPVGPLRWQAPLPPEPWIGSRSAGRIGRDCVQNLSPGSLLGQPGGLFVRGSEDCLFLNVYAPSNAVAGQKWPVMVWLHGGGFSAGTASNYDPTVLAQKQGVIVVTLNYRLGVFGFLALPALSAEQQTGSGDYGLLDQQAALRWVQRNITAFGGDPARVTLFGESAGGFSVCHQLTSPLASHLFSGAIIQSGACTGASLNLPLPAAEAAGEQLARDVGCQASPDEVACLRSTPAGRLARTVSHRVGALGPNSWGTVVGTPVLPLPAAQAFASGAFIKAPVMIGFNHDEGRLFSLLQQATGRLWTKASYQRVLEHDYGSRASAMASRWTIAEFGSPAGAYAALITDEVFACPAIATVKLLSAYTPTWLYEFKDPNPPTTIPHLPGLLPLGAGHATEIAFVLQRPWLLADPSDFDEAHAALANEMQAAWGSFARTGAPGASAAGAWAPYPAKHEFTSASPSSGSSRPGDRCAS